MTQAGMGIYDDNALHTPTCGYVVYGPGLQYGGISIGWWGKPSTLSMEQAPEMIF